MKPYIEITNNKELENFMNQYEAGTIILKDYCPISVSPCIFTDSLDGLQSVNSVNYPYSVGVSETIQPFFDRILGGGLEINFLVTPEKPDCLRYCEMFLAMLQIYMEGKSVAEDRTARHIVMEGACWSIGPESIPVPSLIGVSSRFAENLKEAVWSFYWQVDKERSMQLFRDFIHETSNTYPDDIPENWVKQLYLELLPTLYDSPMTHNDQNNESLLKQYFNSLKDKLDTHVKRLKETDTNPSHNKVPLSNVFKLLSHQNINAAIDTINRIHSTPHESMVEKVVIGVPSSVKILYTDACGLPSAFSIMFGKGTVRVLSKDRNIEKVMNDLDKKVTINILCQSNGSVSIETIGEQVNCVPKTITKF